MYITGVLLVFKTLHHTIDLSVHQTTDHLSWIETLNLFMFFQNNAPCIPRSQVSLAKNTKIITAVGILLLKEDLG